MSGEPAPVERPLAERIVRSRALGMPYADIAAREQMPVADVIAAGQQALAERAALLESGEAAAMLELERLDGYARRAEAVLTRAAGRTDDAGLSLVLRALDRLVLISERRAAVSPAEQAGQTENSVSAELAVLPGEIRDRAAARVAMLLARRLDGGLPAADVTAVARELRITMAALAGLAPAEQPESAVDDLRDRRARRLAADAALADEGATT